MPAYLCWFMSMTYFVLAHCRISTITRLADPHEEDRAQSPVNLLAECMPPFKRGSLTCVPDLNLGLGRSTKSSRTPATIEVHHVFFWGPSLEEVYSNKRSSTEFRGKQRATRWATPHGLIIKLNDIYTHEHVFFWAILGLWAPSFKTYFSSNVLPIS